MTTFTADNQPARRPTAGVLRANPTPKQVRQYRRQLREKADAGNTTALGFLVLCETVREQRKGEK